MDRQRQFNKNKCRIIWNMPPRKKGKKPVEMRIDFGGGGPPEQFGAPHRVVTNQPAAPRKEETKQEPQDMFGRPITEDVPDFGSFTKPKKQQQQQQPKQPPRNVKDRNNIEIEEAPVQAPAEMIMKTQPKRRPQPGKTIDYHGGREEPASYTEPSNNMGRQNQRQPPRQQDQYQQRDQRNQPPPYQHPLQRQESQKQGRGGPNKGGSNNYDPQSQRQAKGGKRVLVPEAKNETENILRDRMLDKFDAFPHSLTYNESLILMYEEFARLYRSRDPAVGMLSEDTRALLPGLQTNISGSEQIEPALLPLKFRLSADREEFEPLLTQWRQSPDALLEQMLAELHDDRLSPETLDPLFRYDVAQLKKAAAAESFNLSPEFCTSKKDFIGPKVEHIFGELKRSDAFIELECTVKEQLLDQADDTRLVACAVHDPLSGLLQTFDYRDPASITGIGEAAPEQEASSPLLEEQEDTTEIDLLLESAMDPFANDFEDEQEQPAEDFLQQSREFLRDMRNLTTRQELEAKSTIKVTQAQQDPLSLAQAPGGDSQKPDDDEDEKSPAVEEKQIEEVEEVKGDPDQIDEIVGGSNAFLEAVNRTSQMQTNLIQAEPSRFHLAQISTERENPGASATMNTLEAQSKNENKSWVVMDNIDVTNFKQMIPEPAITYPFELDEFQKRAVYRLEQGNCVFVAAHTSAGKTLVAEYAIALSRQHMTKTIYTSPIKTLSNQKYRDFKLKFGDVGVLTGDVTLNRDASCMIMTTEVLQAMLYNDSNYVQDVEWVIFDEVHYINDPERGHVWEEVIIKLPDTVSIVMLSATVPNYKEFAEWVGRTKQKKVYVQYTQQRPVPLQHFSILDGRLNILKDSDKEIDMQALKVATTRRARIKRENMDIQRPADQENRKGAPTIIDTEEREKKTIDFKEKAIKAKNESVKKTLAKCTKMANSGGGGGGGGGSKRGPNQNMKAQSQSAFNKCIKTVKDQELLPCICFTFSRPKTVELAENLEGSFDFTDVKQKGIIRRFIKQKLARLEPNDRDLPQINTLSKLLVRGIGVHHAGLLMLLKELVEILFSDGYLKLVIATSTFAIGLNLPARSVMFTTMKKFDGEKMNILPTSEYLQMAGRAGRRGKDSSGMSMLCLDPEMDRNFPSNDEFKEMLSSQGVALESQFKVDYRTCLNTLKEETGQFESLMAQSFLENQNMVQRLQMLKRKQIVEPLYQRTKDIECIHGVPEEANVMVELLQDLMETNYTLNNNRSPLALTMVEVTTAKFWFKRAVVLRVQGDSMLVLVAERAQKRAGKTVNSWPLAYEEGEGAAGALRQRQPRDRSLIWLAELQEHWDYEYVELQIENINKYYTERVPNINPRNLHFTDGRNLHNKHLRMVLLPFAEKMSQGGWKEDHSAYKSKKKVGELLKRRDNIIAKMNDTKCFNCEQLSYHMTQLYTAKKYRKELDEIMKVIQGGTNEKEREFNKRNEILQLYNIIDNDLNLLFKGKVASKVTGADNILLTEFFFSGLITELTDLELLSILSTFSSENRANKDVPECSKVYSENFTKAINFIQKECDKLLAKEQEMELLDNTQQRINWKFYELVYEWADQKPFSELVRMSDIEEGMIVKMLMSTNKLMTTIASMAKVVGDNTLAARMEEMKPLIERGIVKLQSLYLEVEQEALAANKELIGNFDDDIEVEETKDEESSL